MAFGNYSDKDAKRLAKRLEKYREELFTFFDHPDVSLKNNQAERQVRFAVLLRKIIYGNRSRKGAQTQAVLMTIYRTLKGRGHDPIATLVSALQEFIRTVELPPFPAPIFQMADMLRILKL